MRMDKKIHDRQHYKSTFSPYVALFEKHLISWLFFIIAIIIIAKIIIIIIKMLIHMMII